MVAEEGRKLAMALQELEDVRSAAKLAYQLIELPLVTMSKRLMRARDMSQRPLRTMLRRSVRDELSYDLSSPLFAYSHSCASKEALLSFSSLFEQPSYALTGIVCGEKFACGRFRKWQRWPAWASSFIHRLFQLSELVFRI